MVEYIKVSDNANDSYLDELSRLSRAWADEHSCPAYYANEPSEFINHEVYIAQDQGRTVAYALGNIKVLEERTSYNEVGKKAFELMKYMLLSPIEIKGSGRRCIPS